MKTCWLKYKFISIILIFVLSPFSSLSGEPVVPLSEVKNIVMEAMPDWEMIQCDKEPTVKVEKHDGYRILLRKGQKEYIEMTQYPPSNREELDKLKFTIKYSHIDIVLFPTTKNFPTHIKNRIPWKDVEQEYFTIPVHLGEKQGFTWFGKTTIFWQDNLRENLGLAGGDDRLQLAADGLGIVDSGTMTANSVIHIFQRAGERAIPYIEGAIKKNESNDPWNSVYALGFIPGEKSTEILRSLYVSDKDSLSRAASYALINRPLRKSAKNEYLDMLRKQIYVNTIAEACVEFGWKDALPILQEIYAKPSTLRAFRSAFEAKREIEGRPLPNEMKDAEHALIASVFSHESDRTANVDKATILNSTDKESATVVAISLALSTAKGYYEEINDIGREILQQLTPESTKPLLISLFHGIQDEYAKQRVADLLKSLDFAQGIK